MKEISLKSISLCQVNLHFQTPFQTAHGIVRKRPLTILKLTSDCNTTVYSECSALNQTSYHPETNAAAYQTLYQTLIPKVLNRSLSVQTISNELLKLAPHSHFAVASIEMGAWAMVAELSNVPLSQLLGDKNQEVPSGWVLGVSSKEAMRDAITHAERHQIHKLKFKLTPETLSDIVDIVKTENLCERFPFIALDANESFDETTIEQLSQLNDLPISYIEQPFSRFKPQLLQDISHFTHTPVVLDESLQTSRSDALSISSCKGIVLKPSLLGGYQPSLDLIKEAKRSNKQFVIGGLYESGLGKGYLLSLAQVLETQWPSDISPFSRFDETKKDHPWTTSDHGYFNNLSQRFYCDEPTRCLF